MSKRADVLHMALAALDRDGVLAIAPQAVLKMQQAGDGGPLGDRERTAAQQFLALLNTAFVVAAADHKLEQAELEHMEGLFEELSGGVIPHDVMVEFFDLWSEALVREGFEATIKRLAGEIASDNLRRMAYVAAIGTAHADGVIQEAEQALFGLISDAFGIDPPEAVRLREQVAAALG